MNRKNKELVLATGNKGKIQEFNDLLTPLHYHVLPQTQFKVIEAEETGLSFIENALLKARNAAKQAKRPALADDSGLVVDALMGQPGIYSARYAGKKASDTENISKLLSALENVPTAQRGAHFHCCIALVQHSNDPEPIIAYANWYGQILTQAQGEQGFGYDPVFYVPTHHCSAAQLSKSEKNRISHRALALNGLKQQLETLCNQPH